MNWSLGEIKSLAMKASRGSGIAWGQAEELAFAADWLNRIALPGVCILADYLKWRDDDARFQSDHDPLPKICQIPDWKDWRSPFPGTYYQPLLLVPAIAQTMASDAVALRIAETVVRISKEGCRFPSDFVLVTGQPENCFLEVPGKRFKLPERADRVGNQYKEAIAMLEHFASRTYAPPTDTSRTSGAGAGDDGND